MARRSTGSVSVRKRKTGTFYALRFTAYGERRFQTLGSAAEGWTYKKAPAELEVVMAAVKCGPWRPEEPEPEPVTPQEEPTFHVFASEWYAAREGEWSNAPATTTCGRSANTYSPTSPRSSSRQSRSKKWTASGSPRSVKASSRPTPSTRC